MKLKLLTLVAMLFLSVGCKAQDTIPRGRATAYVISASEKSATANTRYGKSLIIEGTLEVNTEYDMVYDILKEGPRTLYVKLVDAEHSDKENATRRARLSKLLYKE